MLRSLQTQTCLETLGRGFIRSLVVLFSQRLKTVQVKDVSERGVLFAFDDPYIGNVYAIVGESSLFICDTFCGPDPMRRVMTHLSKNYDLPSRVVIFNSHADYDHIWGNCHFEGELIICHELCRERVMKEWDEVLERNSEHQRGNVIRLPPNVTFQEKLDFVEEEVEFFHTPGHTRDSASCFDKRDSILFVGDNIESPIPYINQMNIKEYKATLGSYLQADARLIISGHDPPQDNLDLVRANLEYVTDFGRWTVDIGSLNDRARQAHLMNVVRVADDVKEGEITAEAILHYKAVKDALQSMERTGFVSDALSKVQEIISKA